MKHTIVLPDLGQTTSEGLISKWLKQPGDQVAPGEPLVLVETDKATVEVEAHSGGYLRELLVPEGHSASAMAPIAIITDTDRESYSHDVAVSTPSAPAVPAASPTESLKSSSPTILAVPAARTLAKEMGIDLAGVTGSGPGGLIQRSDVERYLRDRPGSRPSESRTRTAMAEMVTKSKTTIPHFYLEADLEMSKAEAWRAEWNASHPSVHASVNDVLVFAASRALADTPPLQRRYQDGNLEDGPSADILLVVAVQERLVLAPVALSPATNWEAFLQTMSRSIAQARNGRISPVQPNAQPLLCISNLGMFNVKRFLAIIPPGCSAALAVGTLRQDAVVRDGRIGVETICSVTLSADHRIVDGVSAAKFLDLLQVHLNSYQPRQ